MKVELFAFQKKAVERLRSAAAEAVRGYHSVHTPQVISFTAPTGAGKTIIMASLIESIYYGAFFDEKEYPEQPDAVIVWLSDSPELNAQSMAKFVTKADKIGLSRCVMVEDDSFDSEVFEDGHIYFLNTQKLGKSSNLTKRSDARQFTIWETLRNTCAKKSDHFYVVIDEAHRGMRGRDAGRATSIMQKFIVGSPEDGLEPMPVVIGMSATSERFNRLVGEMTQSTTHKVVISPEEVRDSGLLKDHIIIMYPEDSSAAGDMAVLQAAAADWKDKWDHWEQYCREQHYAYVNPAFVVQVLNGSGSAISDTDLADCLQKIQEQTGFHFKKGEVVHTFGQTIAPIWINGLEVRYEEPSRIADDKNIKVIFFKENLSTGWDCPRAETMMSFRRASDATYIAQLLGRMIRTPMGSRIQVDETLNDVRLFLPHFDAANVRDIVTALQSAEGGALPTEVSEEPLNSRGSVTLTVRPKPRVSVQPVSGEQSLFDESSSNDVPSASAGPENVSSRDSSSDKKTTVPLPSPNPPTVVKAPVSDSQPSASDVRTEQVSDSQPSTQDVPKPIQDAPECSIDREAVMRAVNGVGLQNYSVRKVRINNYLVSLFKLAHLLTQTQIKPTAVKDVLASIVGMIRQYVDGLRTAGKYDERAQKVREFKMSAQIFDPYMETIQDWRPGNLFSNTDADIDRQLRQAEMRLGNEGVGNAYGNAYFDVDDPNAFKIDVILYAEDAECRAKLDGFAQREFYALKDEFRQKVIRASGDVLARYTRIVEDSDIVSEIPFRLPNMITVSPDRDGQKYSDHLFVEETTGTVQIKLNNWERAVIEEERRRNGFVCWLRNQPRKPWALRIPYKIGDETFSAYPDFLIVSRDSDGEYVVDILEPHNPDLGDNLAKAKGFAAYAEKNPQVGRIQLIRENTSGVTGKDVFRRLDLAKSVVRKEVNVAATDAELDQIFERHGICEA